MQEYMDQTRTQLPLDVDVSMDSYIKAYHVSHEDYQNSEETKHEEIQKENKNFTETDTKRDKRSPPDIIKFEVGDAKNPDFPTQETGRNLRMPFQISDAADKSPKAEKLIGGYFNNRQMIPTKKQEEANDQSIDESRMIQITHPIMHKSSQRQARMHSISELPIAVQKAIDVVLREPNPTNGPSKITVTESEQTYYGDKISKMLNYNKFEGNQLLRNYPNKQWWTSPGLNRSKRLFYRPNGHLTNNFVPSQPQPNIQYIFKETPIISNENKEFQYTTVASRAVTPVPQTNKQFSSDDYTTNPYGPVELHYPPTQQTKFASSQEETGFNVHVVNSIQKPQEVFNYNSPSSTPSPRFISPAPQDININYSTTQRPQYYSSEEFKDSTQKPQYEFKSSIDEQNFNIFYASTQKPEFQTASREENSYEREGSSIAALTALIGQTPSIQLQRLNELLVDDKQRPQDSTAPILFHPGQKPTMPQSPHLLPARPYAPDSFYKTPNNILYYNKEQKPYLAPALKDHTPIFESSSERPPNPLSAEILEDLNGYSSPKVKDTRKVREVSFKKLSKNKLKLRGKRDLNYVSNIFLDQTKPKARSVPIAKKIGFRNIRYVDRMLDYLRFKNNEFLKTINAEITYPDENLSRKKRDLKNLGRSRIIFDNPFVLKPIVSKLTNTRFPQDVTFSELRSEGHNLGKVRLTKKGTTELRDPENDQFKPLIKHDLDDYNDYNFDEEGTIVHDDFEYYDDKYPTTTPPPGRKFDSNIRNRRPVAENFYSKPTKAFASRSDYYDSWDHTTKRYDYILGQPVSDLATAIRKKVTPQHTEEWVDTPYDDNPYDPNYKLVPMTVYKKVPINEPILDKSFSSNPGEIHIENLNIFHSKSASKPKSNVWPKKQQKQHHHQPHHTSSKVIVNENHKKKHHHDDTFNELYIPFLSYFPPGALGH